MIFSYFSKAQSVNTLINDENLKMDDDSEVIHQSMTFTNRKILLDQTKRRKKTTPYGEKNRQNRIYQILKACQNSDMRANLSGDISNFTTLEDQILDRLVKKLGPKFKKISKYFPEKTLNMVKNRYYKVIRNLGKRESSEQQRQLSIRRAKTDVDHLISENPLFPEARDLLNKFITNFEGFIMKCQNF